MPNLDPFKKVRQPKSAEKDREVNPKGVYSGMTKRLAISDGSFVDIGHMPKTDFKGRD